MTRLKQISVLTIAFAFAMCALVTQAQAQDKSRSRGFFVAGAFEGVSVTNEGSDDTESGAGLGLTLGYGFTKRLALYGQFSGASLESADGSGDYGLGHFDLGLRVHFRAPAKTVVPFVQFGLSGRGLHQEFGTDTIDASGAGAAFGGGINVHFRPALAFTTGVTWSVGNIGNVKLNDVEIPGDSSGLTSARVHFGIIWFPQAK